MTYPIPKDALDDRLAVVGTAGSGKTYLTLGAIEHLLTRKARVIVVDPLGVAWGLRLCADGKTPSPFQPVIFGGAHGDLPVNEHAGSLIGETVATASESCIIDLSQLGTKAAERRFMLAFLTALYRHTNKEPVHLIIDEADMFAPQKLLDKDGDAAKLLGMMETVVRRGRARGFIPWLLTQRPAVISKDVLSQADGVVALKLTAIQDRRAIAGWVESTADTGQWKGIDARLPTFQRGAGVLWIPGRGILREVEFPEKATYDSSRTPKRGEKRLATELKPIDLGALKGRLATVETEVVANDPRLLKAENAKLTAELAKLRKSAIRPFEPVEKNNVAFQKGYERDVVAAHATGFGDGFAAAIQAVGPLLDDLGREFGVILARSAQQTSADVERGLHKFRDGVAKAAKLPKRPVPARQDEMSQKETRSTRFPKPAAQVNPTSGKGLGKAEWAILGVLAHYPDTGAPRTTVALQAGYSVKSGSFSNTLSSLRTAGLLAPGDPLRATDAGLDAAGGAEPPLTGRALLAYWCGHRAMGKAERTILEILVAQLPGSMDRRSLAEHAEYAESSGSFSNSLSRLRTLNLISGSKDLRAAEEFGQ